MRSGFPARQPLRGRAFDFIVFDEVGEIPMAFYDPKHSRPSWEDPLGRSFTRERLTGYEEKMRFVQEMEEILRRGNVTSARPNQTQRVLPAFSGTYLVTFIGGPKNGTQEFLDSRAHPYIEDGKIWLIPIFEHVSVPGNPHGSRNETYRYKTVFIPQNETSFTEDICIIALFQT